MFGIIDSIEKKARLTLKRLGQLPGIRMLIIRLWNTYEYLIFEIYIYLNFRSTKYEASINPYCVYWVSPEHVKTASMSFDFIEDTGKVVGGDWDNAKKQITNGSYYERFEKVFDNRISWEETNYYEQRVRGIREGKNDRYVSVEEFENKLQYYEKLYKEFKSGNYKSQSELVADNEMSLPGEGGRALFPSLTDHALMRHEIAVSIGRDGSLLRNDGRHRLALAHLAGVDKIPVRIVVRHSEWQNLRDRVAQAIDDGLNSGVPVDQIRNHVEQTLDDELESIMFGLDHPDLEAIFKNKLLNK